MQDFVIQVNWKHKLEPPTLTIAQSEGPLDLVCSAKEALEQYLETRVEREVARNGLTPEEANKLLVAGKSETRAMLLELRVFEQTLREIGVNFFLMDVVQRRDASRTMEAINSRLKHAFQTPDQLYQKVLKTMLSPKPSHH